MAWAMMAKGSLIRPDLISVTDRSIAGPTIAACRAPSRISQPPRHCAILRRPTPRMLRYAAPLTRPPCVRLGPADPGNPRRHIEGESPHKGKDIRSNLRSNRMGNDRVNFLSLDRSRPVCHSGWAWYRASSVVARYAADL